MARWTRICTIVVVFCLAVAAAQVRAATAALHAEIIDDDDRYYLPPADWMRVFALGYNEVAADLVWIKTIIYFGGLAESDWADGEARGVDNFTINYMRSASELDPYFYAIYTRGTTLTLFHQGDITEQTVQMTIDLLERGVRFFPNDGDIAFNLGFAHVYEYPRFLEDPARSAELDAHREEGIHWIRRASLMPNAPPYVSALSSTLLKRSGLYDDIAIEHIRSLLLKETDPKIRQALYNQLRQLAGAAADRDIALSRQLQKRWHAEMPYISFDLYLILGPHPAITREEIADPLHTVDAILGLEEEADSGPSS